MGEQVLAESLQGVDDRLKGPIPVVLREAVGGGFDGLEIVRDAPVVGLEPVDDRVDGGVGVAQLREEVGVLRVVVAVHEAAVALAVDLQPPEHAVALEVVQLPAQVLGVDAVERLDSECLYELQVPANGVVDGEQHRVDRASTRRLGPRFEARNSRATARAVATCSRTCGATSSMTVRTASGARK